MNTDQHFILQQKYGTWSARIKKITIFNVQLLALLNIGKFYIFPVSQSSLCFHLVTLGSEKKKKKITFAQTEGGRLV